MPRPCSAEIGYASPNPNDSSSHTSASCRWSSTLFATSTTGASRLRSRWAARASSSVTPTVASTTKRTTSAQRKASSAWWDTFRSSSEPFASQPPVSTARKSRPRQLASTSLRSRVTPGRSSTIATRLPTILFNRVDLPTFGRPTIATRGTSELTTTPEPGAGPVLRSPRPPPVATTPPGACRRGTRRRSGRRPGAGSGAPPAHPEARGLRPRPP